MKHETYAVCPQCTHPNVHVYSGRIAVHTVSLASDMQCSGSNLEALEQHIEPLNRHESAYVSALEKAQGSEFVPFREPQDVKPAFTTWSFSGIEFVAVPIDRNNVHIMDVHGNNYGAWMSVKEFRKRQQAGVIADWQALGKAHLSVVSER